MKLRFTAVFFVFLFSSVISEAQGISYMQPDLGTPGMNTYVEFIAPSSEFDFFGTDGFYLNDAASDIRVVTADPADADKVIVGPATVSWGGRMLSTQILVRPDLQPNSTDWNRLDPEFVIDLEVTVDGTPVSGQYRFYIVDAIDYNASGEYIDAVRRRSPRGALVFNSLNLTGGGEFKFDTEYDIDPTFEGNQAYLPAYILVKESIVGNGSTIDASGGDGTGGGNGHGGNGGPGGGGGGGQWKDDWSIVSPSKSGTNGGDGFTGGGKGGTNFSLLGGGHHQNIGTATNENGMAINGVEPPFQPDWSYEAAGGGTGHPFGLSGNNCGDGNSFAPSGEYGYGGGTGSTQRVEGAGGSYATEGGATNDQFKGKAHGNNLIVPFAGGSGGASGNPEGGHKITGGSGGGGGGAVRVFAKEIRDLTVLAEGGRGEDRNFDGGGGSGGAVEIDAKDIAENITISVKGGARSGAYAGGEGYARIDRTDNTAPITFENHSNEIYTGIAIDGTSELVRGRTTPVSFFASNPGCILYERKEGEPTWNPIFTAAAGLQSYDYTVAPDAAYNYTCLVLVDPGAGTGTGDNYSYSPQYLMSQAAANIIEIKDGEPVLECPDEINLGEICYYDYGEILFDIPVRNTGGSDLEIRIGPDHFENNIPGFQIIAPAQDVFTIAPGMTETITISFTPDLNGNLINIDEVFILNHNAPDQSDPYRVNLHIDAIWFSDMVIQNNNNDFGLVSEGKTKQMDLVYENMGNTTVTLDAIPIIDPPFYVIGTNPAPGNPLAPGGTVTVTVEFRPTDTNKHSEDIQISFSDDKDCNVRAYPNTINGEGTAFGLSYPTKTIDFDTLAWCETLTFSPLQVIENLSIIESVQLDTALITGNDADEFFLARPQYDPNEDTYPAFPIDLLQYVAGDNGNSFPFQVSINPSTISKRGLLTAWLEIRSNIDPPNDVILIPIRAYIADSELDYPSDINLGNIDAGYDYLYPGNLTITNNGVMTEDISSLIPSVGDISISPGGGKSVVKKGGSVQYEVNVNTVSGGAFEEEITINIDEPCPHQINIPVRANVLLSEEKINPLDFGTIQECTDDESREVYYENESPARYTIIGGSERIINDPESIFTIVSSGLSANPAVHDTIAPGTLHPGDAIRSIIVADASGSTFTGTYSADLEVRIYKNGSLETVAIPLTVDIVEGEFDIADTEGVVVNDGDTCQFERTTEMKSTAETFTITNTGIWDMEITGFSGPHTVDFSSNIDQNIGDLLVSAGGSISFDITFSPQVPGSFNDEIEIAYKMGECFGSITVFLEGEGAKARTLHMRMPEDMAVAPTLDNCRIPIFLKIGPDEEVYEGYDIDTIEIAIDKSVFLIKSVEGRNGTAEMSKDIIFEGDNRIIRFAMKDVDLTPEESIMAELVGSTLLGERAESDLRFKRVVLGNDGEVSDTVYTHGFMKINICEQGGRRLLTSTGGTPGISVSPNPASDIIDIDYTIIGTGEYILELASTTGSVENIKIWTNSDPGRIDGSESYDVSGLAPGVYFIKLITPTEVYVQKIIVM